MSLTPEPNIGDLRVCKLQGCDVWRIERFSKPRWFAFWLAPSWRVAERFVFCAMADIRSEDEEYRSLDGATRRMETLRACAVERAARKRRAWCCGGAA